MQSFIGTFVEFTTGHILTGPRGREGDRYREALIESMVEQLQTKPKETQIESVGTVNDLVQPRGHGVCPKMNDPVGREAASNHESRQPFRIR